MAEGSSPEGLYSRHKELEDAKAGANELASSLQSSLEQTAVQHGYSEALVRLYDERHPAAEGELQPSESLKSSMMEDEIRAAKSASERADRAAHGHIAEASEFAASHLDELSGEAKADMESERS